MNFSHSTLSFRSLLITVLVAAPGLAQDLTTFTNGTVANANDVNANFNALKTAVTTAQTTANAAATQASFNTLNSTVTTQGNSLTNLTGAIAVTAPKVQLDRRLQFPATVANRKVVLFEGADNDHQFLGFGISGNTLRYHVNNSGDNHVFFAGASTTTSTELMRIQGNGRVGIGTNNPTRAKVEIVGAAGSGTLGTYWFTDSTASAPGRPGTYTDFASLYATHQIWAAAYVAFSDARIKQVEGRSNGAQDLSTLQAIEVTDYKHIDTVAYGGTSQKKVIASRSKASTRKRSSSRRMSSPTSTSLRRKAIVGSASRRT